MHTSRVAGDRQTRCPIDLGPCRVVCSARLCMSLLARRGPGSCSTLPGSEDGCAARICSRADCLICPHVTRGAAGDRLGDWDLMMILLIAWAVRPVSMPSERQRSTGTRLCLALVSQTGRVPVVRLDRPILFRETANHERSSEESCSGLVSLRASRSTSARSITSLNESPEGSSIAVDQCSYSVRNQN